MSSAYVTLYDCPPMRARLTKEACARNQHRLERARRAVPKHNGEKLADIQVELASVAACEGCPGCEALTRMPNLTEVVLPEPEETALPSCEVCGAAFPPRGNRLYCSRRCNEAAKRRRRA